MSTPHLTVWAPEAGRVDVVVGTPGQPPSRSPMTRAERGWWSWAPDTATGAAPDQLDYAFSLDGGEPLPDPRSAWQPHGVDGPSRWFDVDAHRWEDAGWPGPRHGAGTTGGVVYELHVGTFTPEGTFDAAADHLGHLVDLGVDVVEVMPVAAFPGRWGWGYDGVLPYAVHDQYGGPAALQRFVDACHAAGLGVCLDVVHNHMGPSGNYLARFGPYFTEAHTTPWGAAVNLDQTGSEEVRAYLLDNVVRWLRDFHLDALRLDAVHELRDASPRHVLAEMSDVVADLAGKLGRPLDLIAESDLNDVVMVTPTGEGGRGMDAQWADDVHHALHATLTGERQGYYADFAGHVRAWPDGGPLSVLGKVLGEVFLHDGRWSSFRDREWGRPVDRRSTRGRHFVAYLQTHDQVGNRALGDRVSASLTPGRQAAGAALYLLSAFTPMIFMGEEWAAATPFQYFTDFTDPELGDAVRNGRRAEFAAHGWDAEEVPDPQDAATRDRSVLDWSEPSREGHARVLAWYRSLIALRRTEPDLVDDTLARVRTTVDEDAGTLVVSRGRVHVVVNLGGRRADVAVPGEPDDVLASWEDAEVVGAAVRLGPDDVAVLRTR